MGSFAILQTIDFGEVPNIVYAEPNNDNPPGPGHNGPPDDDPEQQPRVSPPPLDPLTALLAALGAVGYQILNTDPNFIHVRIEGQNGPIEFAGSVNERI